MRLIDVATVTIPGSGRQVRAACRRLAVGALAALLAAHGGPTPSALASSPTGPASPPANAAEASDFVGRWQGSLSAGGSDIRIVFHVRSADDAAGLTATLDSPDQGAVGIPVEAVHVTGDSLRLDVRAASAVYVGELAGDGRAIDGEWRQGGTTLPLTLERVDEGGAGDTRTPEGTRRPQHPEPPYPYSEEPLRVDVPDSDATLAGTLTLPPGDGPRPAVVLVSGSGPQDRDGTLAGHRPFLVLADHLARRGVAVLRTDDPGVGGSTGSTFETTLEDRTAQLLAAVRLLRERPDIDGDRIGLLGHSEGGWVVSLAATREPDAIAFAVLLSGPAQSPRELLLSQQRALLAARGAGEAEIRARDAFLEGNLDIIRATPDPGTARARLLERRARILGELPDQEGAALKEYFDGQSKADRDRALWMAGTPWFRHLLSFDAAPPLRRMEQPVLALFGANDLQVPAGENAPLMERLLDADRRADRTVRVLPGMNHLLQPSETGLPAEYGSIDTTVAPAALEAVSRWIGRATDSRIGSRSGCRHYPVGNGARRSDRLASGNPESTP